MKKITLLLSAMLFAMMSFAGVVTFDADADKGNAGTDSNNAAAYQITKDGVTVEVSSGVLGTYNNEAHYRIYKNQTLKISSTAGAITSVQFTCTANGDAKYGPGCFIVDGGNYTNDGGAVGTWTGSATEITFTAATNQVRASQIVVAIDGEVIPDNGGDNNGDDNGNTTPVDPGQTTIEIPAEAQGWNIPAEAIDVLQARAICAGLEAGATTGTKYYVMGYVKKLHNNHESGVTGYGNATFYMENVNGANSEEDFLAFQVYGPNGQKITDPNVVAVGDFVVVYGELTNYMGDTYETVGKGAAYIWNSTNPLLGSTTPPTPPTPPVDPGKTTIEIPAEAQGWDIPAEAIDVLQARAICAGLEAGATTGTKYYVMGYVKKLHNNHASGVSGFGNATFYMENVNGVNSEEDFLAYQVYGLNGEKITDPNVVAVGDFVVVYGELTNYMGNTYETVGKGAAYIWNTTNSLIQPDSNTVNITGLQYADAFYSEYEGVAYYQIDLYKDMDPNTYEYVYPELYLEVQAKSKTALNGTYELLYAGLWTTVNDSVEMGDAVGTVTIKNKDDNNNYSFEGSYVGTDGKTYKFNQVVNVLAAYDVDADYEEIELKEETETPPTPPTPPTDGAIVFDADVDKGNAGTDSNNAAAYTVSKSGVTLEVSSGILGTYNNEMHYRIYKNQTLTVTSTVGNIAKIEFTCTANGDEKYGPGCFTASTGEYGHDGAAVGTWTGDAATVTFTASTNQVRATQIVVTLASATAVEDVTVGATPVKVIENGQLMIIRGEKVYNVLGAQVK